VITHRLLQAAAAIAFAALPALPNPALAQSSPYGYGQPRYGNYDGGYNRNNRNERRRQTSITATVSYFEPFNLWLDGRTHVYLHQGTIINPTGITLRRGMEVTIYGYQNRDGSFNADQIDVIRRSWRGDRNNNGGYNNGGYNNGGYNNGGRNR
jgi:hypothetical protein